MADVPVYQCLRCEIQFVCHESVKKLVKNPLQIAEVFRSLNSAPFIRAQMPIEQFIKHTACETTSGNRKIPGIGIGQLVGFIDEKELK